MKVNYPDIGLLRDNSAESINKTIVVPAKEALRQLRTLVTGDITLRDNSYAAVVAFSVTHGTEYTFQNPLKTTPIGFTPFKAYGPDGSTALPIDSWSFNTTRTDGLTGVSVWFDNSTATTGYAGESVTASLAAASSITLSTNSTAVSVTMSLGPGEWLVSGKSGFTTSSPPTGTRCVASINTSNALHAATEAQLGLMPVNGSVDVAMTPRSRLFVFTATTDVYMVSLATFSAGNVKAYGSLESVRTRPYLTSYTAVVAGILWGG